MNRNYFFKSLFALPFAIKLFAKEKPIWYNRFPEPKEFKIGQMIKLDDAVFRIMDIQRILGVNVYDIRHVGSKLVFRFTDTIIQRAKIVGELYVSKPSSPQSS